MHSDTNCMRFIGFKYPENELKCLEPSKLESHMQSDTDCMRFVDFKIRGESVENGVFVQKPFDEVIPLQKNIMESDVEHWWSGTG